MNEKKKKKLSINRKAFLFIIFIAAISGSVFLLTNLENDSIQNLIPQRLNPFSERAKLEPQPDYVEFFVKTSDSSLSEKSPTSEMLANERAGASKQGYIIGMKRPMLWHNDTDNSSYWDIKWGNLEQDPKRGAIIRIPASEWNETWLEPEYNYSAPITEEIDEKNVTIGYEVLTERKFKFPLESFLTTKEITNLTNLTYNGGFNPKTDWKIEKEMENISPLVILNDYENRPDDLKLHGSSGMFTICPSGCSYTTLALWESNEEADLTGTGPCIANITGDWSSITDTSPLSISGAWVVTATDYLEIIADSENSAQKTGINYTRYVLNVTDDEGILVSGPSFVRMNNLQLLIHSTATTSYGFHTSSVFASNRIIINNSYIEGGTNSNAYLAFRSADNDAIIEIYNTILNDGNNDGIRVNSQNFTIMNSIVYGFSAAGLELDSGNFTVINVAVFSNGNDLQHDGGIIREYNYTASDDLDGNNSITPYKGSWLNEFESASGGDFTLLKSGNLSNAGVGPSIDYRVPPSDLDGDPRSGATSDIGVDEKDKIIPNINFTDPTPSNGSTVSVNSVYVNVSTSDTNDHSSFIDFNRSLRLWLNFESATADGNPYDNSTWGGNGSLVNNAKQKGNEKRGIGFDFDGTNDMLNISHQPHLDTNGNMTISVWAKYVAELTSWTQIVGKADDTYTLGTQGWLLMNRDTSGDRFIFTAKTNSGSAITATSSVYVEQEWHHVVGVINDTNIYLYVDGVLDGTGAGAVGGHVNVSRELTVGNSMDLGQDYNGEIDEVMLFSRALTPKEITALYNSTSKTGVYHNFTDLNEGNYNYTAWVMDVGGNANSTGQRTVTYSSGPAEDTTPPVVTFTNPATNNTNTSITNLNVNFTITDETALHNCWWSNNSGTDNISLATCGTNITDPIWSDGVWNITVWGNDTSDNHGSNGITFTIDTINPDLSIEFPVNNTDYSDINLDINYTVSDTNLEACWYTNDSNTINTTITCGTNITTITWSEGIHNVTVWANDSANNINKSYVNFSITPPDTIPPNVTINTPLNQTYTIDSITFNVTALDETGMGDCLYSLDAGNTNNTMTNASTSPTYWNASATVNQGTINVTFYCNDTADNINNSESVVFFVDTINPDISIVYPNNNTNWSNTGLDVNYTASDTNLASCWYTNDSEDNVTLADCGTNITTITWTEGIHNITVWSNDTLGNTNSSRITFTIDTTNPSVSIVFPTNATNTTNTGLNVNFTRSDINLESCWYSNDSFLVNTTLSSGENITAVTWSEGFHTVSTWCNDSAGNEDTDKISFTIDNIKPDVSIVYPNNNTNWSNVNLDINYTTSDANLHTCWFTNDTNSVNTSLATCGTNVTTITWSEGSHNVTVWSNDSAGNQNYSRIHFTIDTINPDITITTPSNNTNWTNINLDINYTASDDRDLTNCWYSNDTYLVNTSLASCTTNITTVVWSEGKHNVTVWSNDTAGNINNSKISFRIDTTPPSFTVFANQTIPETNSLNYDMDATDVGVGLSGFFLHNWTSNFNVTYTNGELRNNSALVVGEYQLNISVNDTLGNTNWSFLLVNVTSVDNVNPQINIVFPNNNTNWSNINLDVNYTRSDETDLYNCWYSNDTYLANTSLTTSCNNITSVVWSEGKHNVTIWTNDTSGNINNSKISFTIDTVNPDVSIVYPSNNSNHSNVNLDINYTASDDRDLTNCWYTNDTNSINTSLATCGTNITTITWSEGYHNVTVWANDTAGNENSSIVHFIIDVTSPTVTITFPVNNTNHSNINLDVNYTASDTYLESCWYSNDSHTINTSLASCSTNITTVVWNEGLHNVTVYANDTSGNEGQTNVVFHIDTTPPTFTETPTNRTIYNNETLGYNINATDETAFDSYAVNDTTNFEINSSGWLKNITALTVKNYTINITINDSANNINSSVITVHVLEAVLADTTPPTFTNAQNHTQEANLSFSFDLDASDDVGVDSFTINDTSLFNITLSTGIIRNVTNLSSVFITWLNVTVNDTSNNIESVVFFINITEGLPVEISILVDYPQNKTYDTSSLELNVSAVNGTGDYFWYSLDGGTTNTTFTPNTTITNLGWEAYHDIQVWVNDTAGNEDTEIRRVYVGEADWTTAFIIGLIGLIIIYSTLGFSILKKEFWLIKSFLYLSAIGVIIVLINSAMIISSNTNSTKLLVVGFTLTIIGLLIMFLYLFVFFFIEIIKSLKEKRGLRWKF